MGLYPPLAPAPPIEHSSTSQDLFNEVPTSLIDSQYKREIPGKPTPINLVSKSAYTSNDLLDDTSSEEFDI